MIIAHFIEKDVEEYDCGRLGVDMKMSVTDCLMGGWIYEEICGVPEGLIWFGQHTLRYTFLNCLIRISVYVHNRKWGQLEPEQEVGQSFII